MKSPHIGTALGLWYLVAPFVWGYPFGFLWWHSVLIGAAILAISGSFYLTGGRLHGWLLMAVAAYSMASPFLHGYLSLSFPLWNDLVIGVVTMGAGVAMAAAGLEYRAEAPNRRSAWATPREREG